jgi:hypothetical protein
MGSAIARRQDRPVHADRPAGARIREMHTKEEWRFLLVG